jgi:hypothetical protein
MHVSVSFPCCNQATHAMIYQRGGRFECLASSPSPLLDVLLRLAERVGPLILPPTDTSRFQLPQRSRELLLSRGRVLPNYDIPLLIPPGANGRDLAD